MEFAPAERGFDQVGCVGRSLGCSRSHDRMQFVDEEDDRPFAGGDLFDDRLEALFKLAPELRSGDQGPQIQAQQTLVLQRLGHVSAGDPSRQAFDDRRLADSRFPDEHRVVLRSSAEDLHHPSDLFVPSDHRIELSVSGKKRQVLAILFEGFIPAFRIFAIDAGIASDRLKGLHHVLVGETEFFKDPACC